METSVKIRRLCLVEGRSISSVARQFNLSRNTVRKYIRNAEPPKYQRNKSPACPKLGGYQDQLRQWLENDSKRPVKERRNAKHLFEGIQLIGYKGAYDSVQRYVRSWKSGNERSLKQAYVPLAFSPGEACQFDWSHETVLLGGNAAKIKLAHFRLCHSRKSYLRAYPRESQEMVFDAHIRAFEYYGGLTQKMIYDNPRTMVDAILLGKERKFNRRFLTLMNHYLTEPIACTPAAGWEKGQVERQVGVMRQRLFVPKQKFADIDELNHWLEQRCQTIGTKPHPQYKDKSIDEIFAEEQPSLLAVTAKFDGYYERASKLSSTGLVHYDRNQYSAPISYAGKVVSIRAYAGSIVIVADDKVIAEHKRYFGRHQAIYNPWHYVPILKTKPGAIRNGAPFKDWVLPGPLEKIRSLYAKRCRGDKDFVKLLLLANDYGLEVVTVASELAIEADVTNLAVITNIAHRLEEPLLNKTEQSLNVPSLKTPPTADVDRYDQLYVGGL